MKHVPIIIMLLLLTSCVNHSAVKPNPTENISVTELVNNYWKSTESGLISIASLKNPVKRNAGVQSFKLWWCLDNNSSTKELKNFVAQHCSKQNGYYFESWCYEKITNKPIYLAHIGRASSVEKDTSPSVPFCSTGPDDIGVYIVENISKKPNAWEIYARQNLGFLTRSEKKKIDNEKHQKLLRDSMALQFKQAEQAEFMLKNRGTRVCKSGHFGFVEDSNNGKIKINVVGVQTFAISRLEHPYTIWDDPMNWYICEK